MSVAEEPGAVRPVRRWRPLSEKRRIAELTLEPGASVSLVARAHGVNANQVFKWRRALKRGELNEPSAASTALLPVTLSSACEAAIDTGEVGAKGQPTSGSACWHRPPRSRHSLLRTRPFTDSADSLGTLRAR